MTIEKIFTPQDDAFYAVITHAAGPQGALPLTPQMLMESPSGNLFGMTQNAGMGWDANKLTGKEVLIIGTQGGIRAGDGRPVALGYHTGHWEIGMQMQAAAKEITRNGGIPFAAFVSDPCDGRSQGTHGMFDSLPYRNDAAIVFRRLIRSLPTRRAVIGVATCDKGLPATMIALAAMHDLPTILVPGGATLPPTVGEDAGKAQTIGARFANHELSLQEAAELGCRACASPGGGCQFLGTAGTSQVVAEALGLAVFSVLLLLNLLAARLSRQGSYSAMARAADMDPYEWADHKLTYVYNASAAGELSGDMRETVERYMADLEKLNSNSVPKYLAESYFNLGNVEKGFAMLEKFVDYTPSNPGTWDASFRLVMQYNDNSDAFLQGTARLREKLEGWNRDNLGTISLSSDVSDYLDSMLGQSAAS